MLKRIACGILALLLAGFVVYMVIKRWALAKAKRRIRGTSKPVEAVSAVNAQQPNPSIGQETHILVDQGYISD